MIYIKFRKYDPCVRMYWLALAWVYTVPSSVAAGVMYQQPLCGLKVYLVWSVPAVPGSPSSAGLTLIQLVWLLFSWYDPYSVGLNLIQPVWPLFSQSDPYSLDLTPIQLVWLHRAPVGVEVHLVWSVPAVPGSPYLASLTPDSASLTLIQPVCPFSWSDPLFSQSDLYSADPYSWSQSDPYSADPYSAGLTPIQLVWWVPTAPVGVEGLLCTFSACSIWVPLFSALRERNWLLTTSQPWHFIRAAETRERGKSFNVEINWI